MRKEHHKNGNLERNVLREPSTPNAIGSADFEGEIIDYAIIKDRTSRGTFKNGMLNGRGEIIDHSVRNERREFRGIFKDGTLNGEGEMVYYWKGNERREYKGTFKDNGLEGEGEITHYHGNGNKWLEMKGTFERRGLIKGRITFYDEDGETTRTSNV